MNYSVEEMRRLEKAYRDGHPEMSDLEWNDLVKKTGYKEQIGDSETIEKKSANGRNLIEMKSPLISLNKTNKKEDIQLFFKNNKNKSFTIEPKLDGNAFNASYIVQPDGTAVLAHIGSSGDGLNSLECFDDAMKFVTKVGLPDELPIEDVTYLNENGYVVDGTIEFRGESIINKSRWKEINADFITGKECWRNMLAGIMNRKIPSSLVYIFSLLEDGVLDLTDRKSANYKILHKYSLDTNIKDYIKDEDYSVLDVRTVDVVTGKKDIFVDGKPILNHIKPTSTKITARFEEIEFLTYSLSSVEGNKDDNEAISKINGLSHFTKVSFDELMSLCTEEKDDEILADKLCRYCCDIEESDFDKVCEYIGFFFGDADWCSYSTQEFRKMGTLICDGIVIKTIEADEGVMRTGRLAHHPTNRVAVKLLGKKYRTKLLKIDSRVTELGNTTMHGTIEPILTDDGSTIVNINLHNPDWLAKNAWIQEGIDVDVVMSADLIPVMFEVK